MFDLNEENMKKILYIITFTLLLAFFLFNFSGAMTVFGILINIFNPLIYGLCIAFIINIIMKKFEKIFNKPNKKAKSSETKHRKLSIFLSIITVLLVIIITFALIIPQFVNTIRILIENLPQTTETVKKWFEEVAKNNPQILETIQNFNPDWNQIIDNSSETIKNSLGGVVGNSISYINNIFNIIVNIGLGFIIAIFLLNKKEYIIEEIKKFLQTHISEEKYNKTVKIGNLANIKFQKFFEGQFNEAVVVGIITFIAMIIFKMPYALSISVLVGVMSLIPMIGTIIGTLIGAILIIAINPIKALGFIILVIVVQQIEDNLIKPKIVGKNLDLPGVLTIFAVIIGGNNFGILGLILSVPLVATFYALYKEQTRISEK